METFLLYLLHGLAAMVWVGGLVFAGFVLQPAAREVLDGERHTRLWARALGTFLVWSAAAALLVLLTGFRMTAAFGGMARLPLHVNLMMLFGLLAAGLIAAVALGPYRALRTALAAGDAPAARVALRRARTLMWIELHLGAIAFALGVSGKFLV
ncbi:MAG: hypothetical protein D6718_07045 [Acidobacteria bacterium]|nr:MAG: hypothetical protein D6718_07045 [Acidobacteriota bacterium]